MSRRYNVCAPRARKDKTYWHSVGSAFEDDKGITVYLDSSPYPDADGRVVLKLFEPREPQQRPPSTADWGREVKRNFPDADTFDDSAPF